MNIEHATINTIKINYSRKEEKTISTRSFVFGKVTDFQIFGLRTKNTLQAETKCSQLESVAL